MDNLAESSCCRGHGVYSLFCYHISRIAEFDVNKEFYELGVGNASAKRVQSDDICEERLNLGKYLTRNRRTKHSHD